ncbi:DUF3822 family protein [Psychroserpens sp. XS_ASV72]|uniref:DUF3822 family protein n=1 Tax=Psychroserpens sp. XS_ASV72 TaxID=3241293 RepID=UPI00351959FD
MKPNAIKSLSIQIRLSGLSFCILNRSSHTIEHLSHVAFEKKSTPFELLNKLKATIEGNSIFNQEFDSILCIHQNELSTLVPQALFDENQLANYLKFNAKILKTDFISYDSISSNESVSVYVPWVNINNYLFDTLGSFVYKHASTILIDTVLQYSSEEKDNSLYINVDAFHFEIIAVKASQVLLYNSFDYNTPEDFIYYILFSIEQLKMNPETVKVFLSGAISEEDSLYKILYKYVRFVEFIKPKYRYRFDTNQNPESEHSDFLILNSFN